MASFDMIVADFEIDGTLLRQDPIRTAGGRAQNLVAGYRQTFGEILADQVIERAQWRALPAILREFHRVLVDGGKLIIRTPDLRQIAERYLELLADSRSAAHNVEDVAQSDALGPARCANEMLFGNQGSQTDIHKSCLDAESIQALCIMAGFSIAPLKQDDLRRLPGQIEVIAVR